MNQYEIELLKIALENYRKTGKAVGEITPKNAGEGKLYTDALDSLVEQGFVEILSDNYYPGRYAKIVTDTIITVTITYELTNEGLKYAISNLNV